MNTEYVEFTIDDKPVRVPKGTTVYTAITQLGIDIPIFCYHDRMPPFGACRVCLVEVADAPKLQTSCTLEARNGMVVKTQSSRAVKGREEIVELLLINHPLDCPICDRGGECPLQDQALKFGPGESRFFEEKRHFEKPYHLGPVLTLDRERCIVCARCTRFGDIVAGDNALEFIERGYKTEVGTADGKAPKSKFIGNTIAICPVGALTSEVYRFRARPWDNDTQESSCTLCPVGCSLLLDSRDGEIMRTRAKENPQVNDIWLCDKGWFGYEFSASADRLTQPLLRRHGDLVPVSWEEAFSYITQKMLEAKGKGKIAGLGGKTLTIEENYLFQKLIRDLLGSPHVDHRDTIVDEVGGMELPIEACDTLSDILLLGCDITEEFPVIWLRLKKAINNGAHMSFVGHFAPEIHRHCHSVYLHAPGEECAVLKLLKKPAAVFVGRQYLASPWRNAILSELLSWQVPLNIMEAEGNSMGARFAGMLPHMSPFWKEAKTAGLNTYQIIEEGAKTGWDLLYVAGFDIASKVPFKLWEEARRNLGCLIVQDLFLNKTALQADVVLPTLSFVEKGGSFLNIEGRVQKLKPGKAIPKRVYSDTYIFAKLSRALGAPLVIDEPFLDALKEGSRIPLPRPEKREEAIAPTQEGELFASFAPSLFDHGVRMQHNTQLIQLAKEPALRLHPEEAEKRGIPHDSFVTLTHQGKSLRAKVHLDSKVAKKTVVIPLGFEQVPAQELGPNLLNGLAVTDVSKDSMGG